MIQRDPFWVLSFQSLHGTSWLALGGHLGSPLVFLIKGLSELSPPSLAGDTGHLLYIWSVVENVDSNRLGLGLLFHFEKLISSHSYRSWGPARCPAMPITCCDLNDFPSPDLSILVCKGSRWTKAVHHFPPIFPAPWVSTQGYSSPCPWEFETQILI